MKEYYRLNREKLNERSREYYRLNKDEIRRDLTAEEGMEDPLINMATETNQYGYRDRSLVWLAVTVAISSVGMQCPLG